jgi:general secretion pathway protein B
MSYILDALKRAEAERSRGEIPDLHAQPLGDLPAALATTPGRGRVAWLAGGLAILLLGGAGGWWLSRDGTSLTAPVMVALPGSAEPAQPASSVAATSAAVPAASPAQLQVPSAPVGGTPAAGPTPGAGSTPTITLAPAPTGDVDSAVSAAPAKSSKPKVAANAASAAAFAAKSDAQATDVPSSTAAVASGAAAADEQVVALRDLPDDVRASLPPLTVAGATYSENPASRMLIINGKLVHEGDKLTPELTLQQIRLRSAVLAYRGTRFSISY